MTKPASRGGTEKAVPPAPEPGAVARRHARFGWWSLLVFVVLGAVLETLHGFKIGLYLDVSNETRRLMWTLAHAHGTLLALVNLVFGLALERRLRIAGVAMTLASRCLLGATVLMPAGFLLGGAITYAGDPGLGVLLVPVGAVLLVVAILVAARAAGRADPG